MKKLAVVFFLAGCSAIPQQRYTAVGQIIATSQCSQKYGRSDRTVKLIALKTESELYITVAFREDQIFFFDNKKIGELKYHSCGPDVYCFDSFQSLRDAPPKT